MNPDQISQESLMKRHLLTVTRFSKTLAAMLFVTLPFLGFWVGYTYNNPTPLPLSSMVDSKSVSSTAGEKTETVSNDPFSACLDASRGYKTLTPEIVGVTRYEVVYTQANYTGVDGVTYEDSFPYNPTCRVSLIEHTLNGDTREVIPDLLKIMNAQGLPAGLLGSPRPFLFHKDKLIFGGNGYEGATGKFYSLDLKTQKFTPLTDSQPGDFGLYVVSPNLTHILVGKSDAEVMLINIDTLTSSTIQLPDITNGESISAGCEMGCNVRIGWVDSNVIWYGIYRKDPTETNQFLRVGHVSIDTKEE